MAEHVTVTPSGFVIRFEDGEIDPVTGKAKRRSYTVNDMRLDAVSSICGMLDKSEGLKYWAERIGVEGAIQLARDGWLPTDAGAALGRMTSEGLRHWQISREKAKRGTLSHSELVAFGRGEEPRPLSELRPDERGFAVGLAKFLSDYRPLVRDSELMVASPSNGFAGRLDLRCVLGVSVQPNGRPAPPGLGLVDYKTHDKLPRGKPRKGEGRGPVKTPYPEHLVQVGLYEVAARESGFGESGWQAVVRVDAAGDYDFTVSWLDPERAVAMLPAYRLWREAQPRVKGDCHTLPVGMVEGAAA